MARAMVSLDLHVEALYQFKRLVTGEPPLFDILLVLGMEQRIEPDRAPVGAARYHGLQHVEKELKLKSFLKN